MVLLQPLVPVEEVELLAPEHPGERLAHHVRLIRGDRGRGHGAVELVRLLEPRREDPVEVPEGIARRPASTACRGAAAPSCDPPGAIVARWCAATLVPCLAGFTLSLPAVDHELVDAVLDVGALALAPREEPLVVRLVLGEEQRDVALAVQRVLPEQGMRRRGRARARAAPRPARASASRRGLAIQDDQSFRNQSVGRRCSSAASGPRFTAGDPHEEVVGAALGVLHEDVEVAVAFEDAGVEELVLHLLPRPLPVRPDQVVVGEGGLRVLVEVLHVRVGRGAVEVEVVVLHVLAVVALAVRQAEGPLLQDGVLPVPQGEREAEALPVVGDAREAVLSPAVGARAGLVVGEVVPGVAALAVVLADGAPLALAQVGAPLPPGDPLLASVVEPLLLHDTYRFRTRRRSLGAHLRPPAALKLPEVAASPWRRRPRGDGPSYFFFAFSSLMATAST